MRSTDGGRLGTDGGSMIIPDPGMPRGIDGGR